MIVLAPHMVSRLVSAGRMAITSGEAGEPAHIVIVEPDGSAGEVVLHGSLAEMRKAAARLAVEVGGLKLVEIGPEPDPPAEDGAATRGWGGKKRSGLKPGGGLRRGAPLKRRTPLRARAKHAERDPSPD